MFPHGRLDAAEVVIRINVGPHKVDGRSFIVGETLLRPDWKEKLSTKEMAGALAAVVDSAFRSAKELDVDGELLVPMCRMMDTMLRVHLDAAGPEIPLDGELGGGAL